MTTPILFYFDFASPYSYIASEKIDAIAERHGCSVQWRPILLGAVFKAHGTLPLVNQADKADYSVHDFLRSARFHGVPFRQPAEFPVSTLLPARAYYWLHGQDCGLARRFAHGVFRAYFAEGREVAGLATTLDLAAAAGADPAAVEAGMNEAAIKERLRAETDAALAAGVFGAPWLVVDGEPFWGADRLPQVEHWLQTGGF